MPSTKIEFNSNKIARIQGLDELVQLLFPGNLEHQRVFLAIASCAGWALSTMFPGSTKAMATGKGGGSPIRYWISKSKKG